jgi:hypothetical protein
MCSACYQWSVPEDLHEKAVMELRKIFYEGKEYTVDVFVLKWYVSEIKRCLERLAARER